MSATVAHAGISTMDLPLPHHKHCPLGYQALPVAMLESVLLQQRALLRSESNRDHSKMKNEGVKNSMLKQKICIKKTNMLTIIATNFVRERLLTNFRANISGKVTTLVPSCANKLTVH